MTIPVTYSILIYREGGIAVGLPLCHEDCMALRNHYCYKDWALIDDNKRRNVFVKSRGKFREKLTKNDKNQRFFVFFQVISDFPNAKIYQNTATVQKHAPNHQ